MESNRNMDEENEQPEKQVKTKLDEETALKECSIAIFGIPLVAGDRFLKLKKYMAKLLSEPGSEFVDVYPLDEEGQTKGYCFVKYGTKETAETAVSLFDDRRFDARHTFAALPMTAFDNIKKPVEVFKPPMFLPLVDVGDLWSWIQSSNCFDQFAVQYNKFAGKDGYRTTNLAVYWNGRVEPTLAHEIPTTGVDGVFKWSPEGSYLASVRQNSIDLYGGPHFKKAMSFEHKLVDFIEFSPKESFLVSYSSENRCSDRDRLKIFDSCTGELKKSFSWLSKQKSMVDIERYNGWPFIKWAYDESYFAFARPKKDSLAVFDSTTFTLCDSKKIEMHGLVSFDWCPAKRLLAYYCEQKEDSNVPAEVGIMEIPSRYKLRSHRILLFVSAANLFWQKSGDYLAAFTERYHHLKTIRHKETKEVTEIRRMDVTYNLEIFDCNESDISVISMPLSGPLCDLGWEPKGGKFCVLLGSEDKVIPLVYQLERGKLAPLLISKIAPGSLHSILWAPQNGWLTVYGYSTVLFIDANGSEAVMNRSVEHEDMRKACWDPTGRYFVTCSTGVETGNGAFRIHTFQGRLLHRENKDMALVSFKWRPRPPSALTEHKVKEIRKNLKQLSMKFEEEDRREQMDVFSKQNSHHRKAMEMFMAIREENRVLYEQEHDERVKLRSKVDLDVIPKKDPSDETDSPPLATEEMKDIEKEAE